jgi:Fur family ferric uptake transcriptional regulator
MSSSRENLTELMRQKGLRMTSQRRILAELLESAKEHLDADQVYELAKQRDPRLHRATVYRTLNTLKKMGLVDELDLMHVSGDRHYYEIRPSEFHIHLVCSKCGKVAEPSGPLWQDLKRRIYDETGFRPEVLRVEMAGTCAGCQSKSG